MKNVSKITSLLCLCIFSIFVLPVFAGTNLYVASGGSATSPYDSWAKAANDIQTAMGIAVADDTVLVSNGVYVGSMGVVEDSSNVVIITTGVVMRSVNGPAVTTIQGADLKRCVYMSGSNTVLDGFTLTGCIMTNAYGGGAFCANYAQITNCVVVSNSARYGGGVNILGGGYIDNCIIETNRAPIYTGGGIRVQDTSPYGDISYIRNCTIIKNFSKSDGGGINASRTIISGCVVSENSTATEGGHGGGIFCMRSESVIQNSLIYSNYGGRSGGGLYLMYEPIVRNCTIIENTSRYNGGGIAAYNGALFENTIIYNNYTIFPTSNTYWTGSPGPTYTNCCMAPLTNGTGNIDLDPQMDVPATGILQATSPCIDAGTNMAWMVGAVDVEGDPRIFNDVVDIGADEAFVGGAGIVGNGPLTVQWRVPKGAAYQWQTVADPSGTWTDFGGVSTALTSTISFIDSSGLGANNFRVIWEK